ncbi:unnamed protein product [Lupinus luteus]|uniref:Protein XRI1 n=1 Tax=Lupinus luteus TaxID=3873 RepID=A0AAV1Y2Q1_LUPLU
MDFNNHNGTREPWDWHGEDFYLQNSSDFDIPQQLLNETTPVKDCGDVAYNVNSSESHPAQKEPEDCRETSSQAKRRRMLQFKSQDGKEDDTKDVIPEMSQWLSGASGNASASASASSYEDLDLESAEGWLADCFKGVEMQLRPDDSNFSGAHDVHIGHAELCNLPPALEQNVVRQRLTRTPQNIVFKGRKSFIRTPTKLASTVAYPFAFIKPSGVHGDVTLKEINQRILTPPPSKSKLGIKDASAYPRSPITGKPVVGKTKIRTEGGKGSITIMRTKG